MKSLYSSEGKTLIPSIEVLACFGVARGWKSRSSKYIIFEYRMDFAMIFRGQVFWMFGAKCANLEASARLFIEVPYRNCVTWWALMLGFSENRQFKEPTDLFHQMLSAGVQPVAVNLRSLVVLYTQWLLCSGVKASMDSLFGSIGNFPSHGRGPRRAKSVPFKA
ncbi:Hypothetical predicted protein [Olea europaea subsp. europaea]|uniref:Pentatricopeptide repeat-containing protein n=1 Tax=Olea europaea subsp. europaea TaxID=158383 RepID=A0A8S0UP77_OLEEU|nr:Hypothetical predicted protein [Olea europaea subsp. europaea]